MKKYIHTGCSKFDPNRWTPISNVDGFVKPRGGLWASATDAELGWQLWCEREHFHTEKLLCGFKFSLAENARILEITPENVWELPIDETNAFVRRLLRFERRSECGTVWGIDFEALSREYDVLECNLTKYPSLYWSLYGWDCDCILVMNPDVIILEE